MNINKLQIKSKRKTNQNNMNDRPVQGASFNADESFIRIEFYPLNETTTSKDKSLGCRLNIKNEQ
jgi:hypothetical protein